MDYGGKGDGMPVDDSKKLSRQIGWLNKNAGLMENLSFSDVNGPLSMLPVTEAMKILKDLENNALTIKNPTSYVMKAAGNAMASGGIAKTPQRPPPGLGGMGFGMPAAPVWGKGGGKGFMGGFNPMGGDNKQISKKIGELNKSGVLQQNISYSDVIGLLAAIPTGQALKILDDLEKKGAEIKDPTGYVSKAAKNAGGGGGGGGMMPMMQQMMGMMGMGGMGGGMGGSGAKDIGKQVGQLNKSGVLVETISYSDVVGPLSQLDGGTVAKILSDLQNSATEIKNPTRYIVAAAERAGARGGMHPGGGFMPSALKRSRPKNQEFAPNVSPEGEDGRKISQAVGWLNKSGTLMQPLSYSDVKPHLEAIDVTAAQKILEDLEQSAHVVKDPTKYVTAAAKRIASGEGIPAKKQRL